MTNESVRTCPLRATRWTRPLPGRQSFKISLVVGRYLVQPTPAARSQRQGNVAQAGSADTRTLIGVRACSLFKHSVIGSPCPILLLNVQPNPHDRCIPSFSIRRRHLRRDLGQRGMHAAAILTNHRIRAIIVRPFNVRRTELVLRISLVAPPRETRPRFMLIGPSSHITSFFQAR